VVASYEANQPVSQREVAAAQGGELLLGRGLLGSRRVGVSAATTARALQGSATAGELDAALTTFTAARYGRADTFDTAALDEALAGVIRAANRIASQHTWIAETGRGVAAALRGRTTRAWAR
jgi:hypothetical protein